MAVTSAAMPSWDARDDSRQGARHMHCTADTENGDYIDDPDEAQLTALIAGLGQASGSFITINPADQSQGWYASVSLLPDGTIEIEHTDPDRDEDHRTTTTNSPASIARTLNSWLAARG
jgi:hypothetical protein